MNNSQVNTATEQYLRTMVLTATPAKLRFLLLERAIALVEAIKEDRMRSADKLVDEKTITLRDILGELLSGVKRSEDQLSQSVSDLYVFLLQELTYAEQEMGTDRIDTIGTILEIEKDTWQQVCEGQSKRAVPAPMMASGMTNSSGITAAKSINFSA